MRPSLSSIFMSTALLFAKRSTCLRKQVGAVLVKDNRIVSTGYSGAPPGCQHCTDVGCLIGSNNGCIRTIHAETNVILFAAKNGISTNNTRLYTTLSPCLDCAKLIVASGINEIYYYDKYRDEEPIIFLQSLNVSVCYCTPELIGDSYD